MADRQRQTNRFNFRGLNTRLLADSLSSGKSPLAIDIRALGDSIIRTRPGYTKKFAAGAKPATDVGSYVTLGTDGNPRIVVHDSGGGVWLDDGVQKGTVGQGGLGASFVSYRPNQSSQSWLYICNATGYKKFSAPDASNNVTVQKVGIAEPQSPPDACVDGLAYNEFTNLAAQWSKGGTAGNPSDQTRTTDTATAIFQDPASVSPATRTRYSVQVGTVAYSVGQTLTFNKAGGGTIVTAVEDVYPPINGGTALTVQSIIYLNGLTGHCIVVPSQLQNFDSTQMPILPDQISGLRRGSLIQIGTEVVFVLSVTAGPQGQIAIECSTTNSHSSGNTIVGINGIGVSGITSAVVGQTVTSADIKSAIATGVGTLSQTLATNPFNLGLGTIGTPQDNDHIHISVAVVDTVSGVEQTTANNLLEFKVIFDVGDGSFTRNALYYSVTPSVLQAAIANKQTQLTSVQQQSQQDLIRSLTDYFESQGYSPDQSFQIATAAVTSGQGLSPSVLASLGLASSPNQLGFDPTLPQAPGIASSGTFQFTEIIVPITDLTRIGNDQSKTLANCGAVEVLVNCSAEMNVYFGSIWVGGGGQPDLGDSISPNPTASATPYLYRVRPRSALTGARGNPSPAARYGVEPHRQKVVISLPSASYDSQIDTWDIERYGGTVTSWRRVGTANGTDTTFVDNVFDDAAGAGEALEFDNFEPWPSVDVPWNATVGVAGVTSIVVYGTAIVVLGPSTAFLASTLRWLPGTLVTLNGQVTYTLWNRPVAVAGGVMFRIIENAGNPTVTTLVVNEPNAANQNLPYMWGPDSNGIVFAVGDPLRPGALYSAKQSNPDSSPNNIYDLTSPSEPLLGGEIVDGLSMVASAERWWMLQAAFSTPKRWNPVAVPAGRGLISPFAHCTDDKFIYFWAKDGIYSMIPGLPAVSLTEADLGNLFPNVDGLGGGTGFGVPKDVVYAGYTFYAPDYSRSAQFRLSITNSFLRAHYRDSLGTPRTIVLDMSLDSKGEPRMAWSVDAYNDKMISSYQPPQPSSHLLSTGPKYIQTVLADWLGNVYYEADLSNDNGVAIQPAFGTAEWDAGDPRTQKQWLDAWIDCIPAAAAGIKVSPATQGILTGVQSTIASLTTRTLPPFIVALGSAISNFLGLIFQWTDDFSIQSIPTQLYEWSTEAVVQPVLIRSWQSVPTSHGLQGYHHIGKIVFAYLTKAANTVTLTITSFDGTSPAVITLPATNGAYQKLEFVPTFNKGLLFTYKGSSSDQWAPILEDCEIHCGAWNRNGPYVVFTGLGGVEAA